MPPSTASANTTPQRHRRKKHKSVHFDNCVQGVQVPSLEGMSAHDRQRIWHSVSVFVTASHCLSPTLLSALTNPYAALPHMHSPLKTCLSRSEKNTWK